MKLGRAYIRDKSLSLDAIERLIAEAEARAKADYEAVAGRVIVTAECGITGYVGDTDEQVEVYGHFHVRVDKNANPGNLTHWCDEYLDPYWDVSHVEDYLELRGLRSMWTYGPSYKIEDGQVVREGPQIVVPVRRWANVRTLVRNAFGKTGKN